MPRTAGVGDLHANEIRTCPDADAEGSSRIPRITVDHGVRYQLGQAGRGIVGKFVAAHEIR
jgi:hypothetical protein